ncbi:hypothetical protein JCM18899A_40970 [Nocardioides sp. AN3]
MSDKTWSIYIRIADSDVTSQADVVLTTDSGRTLHEVGVAHRRTDPHHQGIDNRLAACRALAALGQALREEAIEGVLSSAPTVRLRSDTGIV